MKANNILRTGRIVRSILGIALFSASLVGCGSDLSTNPGAALNAQGNDDVGTIPVPARRSNMPTPQALVGEILSANTVLLRWKPVAGSYSALIKLDGQELASVAALDGQLIDASIKGPGTHVYDVCFTLGKNCGSAGHVMLDFGAQTGAGDERRGGGGDRVGQGSE